MLADLKFSELEELFYHCGIWVVVGGLRLSNAFILDFILSASVLVAVIAF